MVSSLADYIRQELGYHNSLDVVRKNLLEKGFLEEDVDKAIYAVTKNVNYERNALQKRYNRIFGVKEVFDRIGYGFASQQIVNILFSLTGASLFVIGLVNGIKAVLSSLLSSFLKEYAKLADLSKGFISKSGLLFGLSFLFIALATTIGSVPLFITAFLLGTIGVVSHGDLYHKFFSEMLHKEKRGAFLRKISYSGIIITCASLLMAGFIMDLFPVTGAFTITLFGSAFPLFGYLLAFEVAAVMFILSGYVMSFLSDIPNRKTYPFGKFLQEHYATMRNQLVVFRKNKVVRLMLTATIITGVVQTLGTAFYGIYIYQNFSHIGFGGFMNVIVIFLIAILVAFLGPSITRLISKHVGEAPMLVFGTLLIALLNFIIAFSPSLLTIGAGIALATIGSAIIGVAQGLLALKLLSTEERTQYFSSLSLALFIPFLILIPAGALLLHFMGFQIFYAVLGIALTIVVAPLYFVIVLVSEKSNLV
ncbi:hypothetical protein C4573_04175 [Candidatus Woesearchaeota archaeon]|nr:MAG: hypothetical protein C4573_04175 [Candidatus Woesearchaeota archaeon]